MHSSSVVTASPLYFPASQLSQDGSQQHLQMDEELLHDISPPHPPQLLQMDHAVCQDVPPPPTPLLAYAQQLPPKVTLFTVLVMYTTNWFSNHRYYRPQHILTAEAFLFFTPTSPTFNRWYLVLPILLIQMCVGSLYSFSIFNAKLDEVWGTPGANANAYLLCIAFYGLATVLFGVWVERSGPRRSTAVSLVLCPLGWSVAALGSYVRSQSLENLFLLHGIGAAFAYISLTSCLSRWFSEFKGLFTGIAVMGVGFGSFCWTSLGKTLLDPLGPYHYEVWRVQGLFALAMLVVIGVCTPLLRDPPPEYTPPTASFFTEASWRGALLRALRTTTATPTIAGKGAGLPQVPTPFLSALHSQEMVLLAGVFFCAEITGLVFLSSASDMVQNTFSLGTGEAIAVTSYLNLSNFFGRVAWGFASDKLGRRNFFLLSTAVQALATGMQAAWIASGNFSGWLASFLVIGTLYGGGFGVIPALCSDLFGSHISAATHGVMIGVWASAAVVGIPIFTSTTAQFSTLNASGVRIPTPRAYIINSLWLCTLPVLGFILALFLNVSPEDRAARVKKGGLRARIGEWALCITVEGGIQLLSKAELMREEAHGVVEEEGAEGSGEGDWEGGKEVEGGEKVGEREEEKVEAVDAHLEGETTLPFSGKVIA